MREIKFRGFNHENGWVYGMYVDSFIVDDVVEYTNEYIALGRWCPVDIDSVGQYTGLKDKDGVEIYEGDIVKANEIWDSVVEYKNGAFRASEIQLRDLNFKEIIGNIHENPELLEV